jgi:hypothetical protein
MTAIEFQIYPSQVGRVVNFQCGRPGKTFGMPLEDSNMGCVPGWGCYVRSGLAMGEYMMNYKEAGFSRM